MNKIINKLVYLSSDGYNEIKQDILGQYECNLEINCKNIYDEETFWKILGEYFNFPTPVENWDAFSDWMRDLEFWDLEKSVNIVLVDYDQIFKYNFELQAILASVFYEAILPYWEYDVIKVTSGRDKPRKFDVHCVLSKEIDW